MSFFPLSVLLAHGALGIWDEVIFIGVIAAFAVMMVISWLRSRSVAPQDETPGVPRPTSGDHDSPDRFTLD